MNIPLSKSQKLALLAVVPLALFFVAHERASWRPHQVAGLPYDGLVVISPDDRLVANTSKDAEGLLSVRDLSNGEEVRHMAVKHQISCLNFAPQGAKLAVAWRLKNRSTQLGVGVWDFDQNYRELEPIKEAHLFDVPTQVRFSPDGKTLLLASTEDLYAWDIPSGELKWQLQPRDGELDNALRYSSAVSSNGRFYFRRGGNLYTVWDVKTRKCVVRTRLRDIHNADLIFSPDADRAMHRPELGEAPFYELIETRTGRVIYRTTDNFILQRNHIIFSRETGFEVSDKQATSLKANFPTPSGTQPLSTDSTAWLYTMNYSGALFRQRLE